MKLVVLLLNISGLLGILLMAGCTANRNHISSSMAHLSADSLGKAPSIIGTVHLESGEPEGGAEVLIECNDDRTRQWCITNGEGEFQSAILKPGLYTIAIKKKCYDHYNPYDPIGSVEHINLKKSIKVVQGQQTKVQIIIGCHILGILDAEA